eukprot:9387088-Lingulodinium_polyedra.AAC.1
MRIVRRAARSVVGSCWFPWTARQEIGRGVARGCSSRMGPTLPRGQQADVIAQTGASWRSFVATI